jgi:selenocysteine lyase/cysteine desulfurase
MTTLTFHVSRAIGRTWKPGDEIILSDSDHDANFTPWSRAASDAGAIVKRIRVRPDDGTLDLDDYRSKLSSRTRLVAVGCASNATGTVHPVKQIAQLAGEVGALTYLDAVHYAPHALMNAVDWGCDFLVCSAYKFFGPHVGILWGKRASLESLPAYKVRPASDQIPDRWMTGTPNIEGIAGTLAAVEYLADLGRSNSMQKPSEINLEGDSTHEGVFTIERARNESGVPIVRRKHFEKAMNLIQEMERSLVERLVKGIQEKRGFRIWGITDPTRFGERVPTVSITHQTEKPACIARRLGEAGIFVWHGNFYAQPLTEALGLEPEGMVRIGLVHYNTSEEIDRFLEVLS